MKSTLKLIAATLTVIPATLLIACQPAPEDLDSAAMDDITDDASGEEQVAEAADNLLANHAADRLIAPEAGLPPNYPSQKGNSCQSHAGAWALSWALYRRAVPNGQAFSAQYRRSPYYVANRLYNSGATLGTAFTDLNVVAERMKTDGVSTWDQYNNTQVWDSPNTFFMYLGFNNPSAAAATNAGSNKPQGYTSLSLSGNGVSRAAIKAAIDNKRAVMLKIWLDWNGNTPVLPTGNYTYNGTTTPTTWNKTTANTRSAVNANAHIVTVYGYNDTRNVFYAQNSWGSTWGDNGRFAISYPTIDQNTSQAVYVW